MYIPATIISRRVTTRVAVCPLTAPPAGDTKGHVTVHIRDDVSDDVTKCGFSKKQALFNEGTDEVTALECNPYFPFQVRISLDF